ncbi:MAG: 1-deoxy-D-xylulose-5-phosphate reductoisomerase, partial [Alphaproteobacteria bacterium]|nr:1-deoxy-D-xylulose-5-phosphate reductoisomerase [Alphaproteobacteria bacterium]
MVEYADGSVLAQLGAPDMRTPIAHALAWPDRMKTSGQRLDFTTLSRLDFEPLDEDKFPSVGMAYACLRAGLPAGVAFNAANETAVAAFLAERIGFPAIVETVRRTLDRIAMPPLKSLEEILAFDREVRESVKTFFQGTAPGFAAGKTGTSAG